MSIIFLMSVRLGILASLESFNHLLKFFEQVHGIVRTRGRFRMVLHAECRELFVADAFDRVVVQVDVRDFDIGGERRFGPSRGS